MVSKYKPKRYTTKLKSGRYALQLPHSRRVQEVTKPHSRQLVQVIKYLEEIGLSVYGPNIDLDTGYRYMGNLYYGPNTVVRYRVRWHRGELDDVPREVFEGNEE